MDEDQGTDSGLSATVSFVHTLCRLGDSGEFHNRIIHLALDLAYRLL
jgi:hypothetical protein